MCGIVGWVDGTRGTPECELRTVTRGMAAALTHRGPDSEGNWVDEVSGIALGHRRLAILDLTEGGAQPMASHDGRYVLCYNGEAYNFRELRESLRAGGVRFTGASDTEVVVEAVAAWGLQQALQRINGMFAFALWDRHDKTLILARDRIGEKPLYFWIGGDQLVFASELGALRRHPATSTTVDQRALALFLRFGYVPAPWSILNGTRKLLPGCTLTVQCGTGLVPNEPEHYWDLARVIGRAPANRYTDEREAADALEELLIDAVKLRLESDVPIGAFLSGGIDSSTVAAVMQRVSSRPVKTFCIASSDSSFDEGADAARVARHLGTDHLTVTLSAAEALAIVPTLPAVYSEPFADSSQIPTVAVSQLARRQVTVSLSGDGGDELFGGYNRHRWVPTLWRGTHYLPLAARRKAIRALEAVPPGLWRAAAQLIPTRHRPRSLDVKVSKAARALREPTPWAMYQRLVSQWQDPGQVVVGCEEPASIATSVVFRPAADIATAMMLSDASTYLPDDILTKLDRASMSVGLEARVPLLDHRLVEFAFHLPLSMKVRAGTGKWLLREVLRRYVQPELTDRPKAGFGVPLSEWLRGPLKGWAEDLLDPQLLKRQGYLQPDPILSAWRLHSAGSQDRAAELWCVLMFQQWLDHQSKPA